jgi:hypothetical protein
MHIFTDATLFPDDWSLLDFAAGVQREVYG